MTDGFDPSYFPQLARLEETNFWFRSRNKLIIWVVGRYFSGSKKMMEIGCGTGYVLSGIQKAFPGIELSGSEMFADGLAFASQRVKGARFLEMDAKKIPFQNEFDLIGAFDVLEHIDDDRAVLNNIHRALKPGGGFLVTVPQHPWLWSAFDDFSHHVRRYTRHEITQKMEEAGFCVLRSTSFVSFLLPAMVLSRQKKSPNGSRYDGMAELKKPGWINFLLERILDFERQWIRAGISFPAGGSLLIAAKKKDVTA